MSDRREDNGTRDRIDRIEVGWQTTTRWLKKYVRWLVAAMVILYLAAGITGYFLADAYDEIQQSRFEAEFRACEESNGRHDRVVVQYQVEFEAAVKRATGERRVALRASRDANVRLIDKLVPVHKDSAGRSTCRAYAERVTQDDAALI